MNEKTPQQREDRKFMLLAIRKAREGIRRVQTPFGACIVKDGKVIALEHNIVWKSTDITAHAEVSAIRVACEKLGSIDLGGATIYSTCEPCPMCLSACHWAGIARVVFGANIRDAAAFGFRELYIPAAKMKRLGKSPLVIKGNFLRQENLRLFKSWSRRPDKKVY